MITGSDILQVDGVVITGVLILLTIFSFKPKYTGRFAWLKIPPRLAAAIVIIPFAISAIILLMPITTPAQEDETRILADAAYFSVGGFVYLILVVIFLRIQPIITNQT